MARGGGNRACATGGVPGQRRQERVTLGFGSAPSPRSTPTCVGITGAYRQSGSEPQCHPHVRGDHSPARNVGDGHGGPPPRAWGSLDRPLRAAWSSRSTPTCVGITPVPRPPPRGGPGPPPRAWGSPLVVEPGTEGLRSTPTCVGITRSALVPPPPSAVHPHVRGDHVGAVKDVASSVGPPPRAWGSRGGRPTAPARVRSTPTCVGITQEEAPAEETATVHPHVRGDHCDWGKFEDFSVGPPPRAWGSHCAPSTKSAPAPVHSPAALTVANAAQTLDGSAVLR